MPLQGRDALWACEICGIEGFRTFEEAKAHELDCRKRQRPGSPPRLPPPYATNMGPLVVAASEVGHYPPYHDNRHVSPGKFRRIPLMGPEEGQHLDAADAAACQNIEVFEAGPDHVADYDAASPGGPPVSVGQVGIRCIHCIPATAYSTTYPEWLGTFASTIRMLSDRHLSRCNLVHPHVRELAEKAASKRQRNQEERRVRTPEDDRNDVAMDDFCVHFSRSIGLVDKHPPKSGVVFRDIGPRRGDPSGEHYRHENSIHPPGGQYLGSRPPPPMASPHESIAATPLARRNKTEHDRTFPPHSAEREGYSAFQPQHSIYSGQDHVGVHGAATHGPRDPPGDQRTPQGGPLHDPPHSVAYSHHAPYDVPAQSNFPYYQDLNGSWICRYCSSVHPQYRDHGAIWSSPDHSPPPAHVIDQHLSVCRSYNQSLPPLYHYQGHSSPTSHYGYSAQHFHHYGNQGSYHHGPPSGWTTSGGPQHPSMHPTPYPPTHAEPAFQYHGQGHESRHSIMHGPPQEPHGEHLGASTARAPASTAPPARPEASDTAIRDAIEVLLASHKQHFAAGGGVDDSEQLVLDEDKGLLTDYFFHLMRQLKLCRFSEADRKTRGGKRENIAVGYGGLQCIHCAEAPNSRKFFWSNVDRLANSFAEIPGHVLKCRRCPNSLKTALMELKRRHPEQMARLARGSQKVFFRRMWRRLHDEDPEPTQKAKDSQSIPKPEPPSFSKSEAEGKPTPIKKKEETESPITSGDENGMLVERSSFDAAKALAASSGLSTPPSPSSRVRLAIPEDKEWLSDMDCFIRRNLEVFCATEDDVDVAQQDRKYPVLVGQVGIRCIHCALSKNGLGARGTAVSFPYSINGIYESVREFQRLHLESCPNLPKAVKLKLAGFKGSASLSSVLRKYYVLAARGLGMQDTPDGIRSGAEPIAVGPSAASAFATSDNTSARGSVVTGVFSDGVATALDGRKRRGEMQVGHGSFQKKSKVEGNKESV